MQASFQRWLVILLVGLCAGGAPAAAAKLELAYWAPDRGTPYQWFETAQGIQSFFDREYVAAGYVVLHLRNDGKTPLTAKALTWNGRPFDALRQELSLIWWRLLPDTIPPGGTGEVMVRPREPLRQPATVRVTFSDGSAVQARVAPKPVPVRIETIGFSQKMDELFLVVERLDKTPQKLTRVWLDGQEVTARCRFLDPTFSTGISPVVLKPARPLRYASYHTYRVATATGATAGCCVRTYDGWVPLGSYGYNTYEEYARNGANGHNSFGRHSKSDLDTHALLGMRAVMILGDTPPAPEIRGHRGIFAYGPVDEPDCQDYFIKEDIPHPKRIGYHAMEMARRFQLYRRADPRTLGILTLDLTYKPANYYVYAPLPDVVNPDCYPIMAGNDAKMVREVVETARYAAGPRPVTFTFEGCFWENTDPEVQAKKRFPRPPFAAEVRLMIYYAIGAGARGLYNYIHCTERLGDVLNHGSTDYPDVWRAIGRAYRELDRVAPLLAVAHPTKLAQTKQEKVSVSTLVAGADSLLLVVVNEDYTQEAQAFRVNPRRNVTVTLPALPWLRPKAAWQVGEGRFAPLKLTPAGRGVSLRLDRLDVAELILVTADPARIQPLEARLRQRQSALGKGLLALWRQQQAKEGQLQDARRRLLSEFDDCMVLGKGIGAYNIANDRHWNPAKTAHWGFEFGQNEAVDAPEMGAEWTFAVPAERAGQKHVVYALAGAWGQPARFVLVAPDGRETLLREVSGGGTGTLFVLPVTFPSAGDYTLRFLQAGRGPRGGNIAHALYVVPADRNPPDVR
ncbi:MAG: hypothetical protein GX774_19910 [Armatimonadetes bacterium]|nr:hypothetical protein [Armatimonadota bacterium]